MVLFTAIKTTILRFRNKTTMLIREFCNIDGPDCLLKFGHSFKGYCAITVF